MFHVLLAISLLLRLNRQIPGNVVKETAIETIWSPFYLLDKIKLCRTRDSIFLYLENLPDNHD